MMMRVTILVGLWLVSASCNRRAVPEPVTPTASAAPTATNTSGPVDLTPVRLAAYEAGSSCNLIHDGEALYWLVQSMAEETGKSARKDATAGACGATLDCSRTRGTVMKVAVAGGSEEVVAHTSEWPWMLEADATSLTWIGYCSSALWTVAKSGGTPRKFEQGRLTIIDQALEPERILVADRFGSAKGIHAIDRQFRGARLVAAGGAQPWLIGTLGSRILWAEGTEERGSVYAATQPDERVIVGEIRGMPMGSTPVDGGFVVQTTSAVVRIGESGPPVELAPLSAYGDRGSLAIDAGHVYWANGRAGTLTRIGRDGGAAREAQVGGEPCGVAVDADHVYWLDRGRGAVMRAPLALFAGE